MSKFTQYNENLDIFGSIRSNGSTASTVSTIAFGKNNKTTGNYSTAFGSGTTANGVASNTNGKGTTATGDYSYAGGNGSIASGTTSFVHGVNSIALGNATIVLGSNITGSTANTTYVDAFNIKSVGTGTSITNLGIDTNGNIVNGTNVVDIRVTGFTNANNLFTITDSTGGTFSTLFNTATGLTINGNLSVTGNTNLNALTANTISATTYFNLPQDVYVTGLTFDNGTYDITAKRNDGVNMTANLGILATDMTVTGGTYNPSTGVATFTNNSGGTFQVTGFLTGMTDTYTTAFTYTNNVLTISRNAGQPDLSVLVNTMTGLTINGNLSVTGSTSLNTLTSNTISATTYQNLPTDIRVTGGTATRSGNNTSLAFTNNTGGTFTVTGITDTFVTGGTYSSGTASYTNNSGNTFTVTGFTSLGKYVTTANLTGDTAFTITHNLNTIDIIIQFKDLTNNEILNVSVDNYQVNSVDITSAISQNNVRVMIIGL